MLTEPIRQVYPELSPKQQKAVRQLLVKRFSIDITRWLRETTGYPEITMAVDRVHVQESLIEGNEDSKQLLEMLFKLAQQQKCDSILKLTAAIIDLNLSVANELVNPHEAGARKIQARMGDVFSDLSESEIEADARKMAIAESHKITDIVRDAFPGLSIQMIFREMNRRQTPRSKLRR